MEDTVRDKDIRGKRNVREAQVTVKMCHLRFPALNLPTSTEAILLQQPPVIWLLT